MSSYTPRILELIKTLKKGAVLSPFERADCLRGLKQVLTERKLFWDSALTADVPTQKAYMSEDIIVTFNIVEFFTVVLKRLEQVETENASLRAGRPGA